MLAQILFTVFAMLAAALASFWCWHARESAQRAHHHEHRLAIMRGQVQGLESAVVALDASHRKLQGRVYADEYWRGKNDKQPELQPAAAPPSGDVCENYRTAQREGPTSSAAKCECAFCEAKREERRQRRASLRAGVKT